MYVTTLFAYIAPQHFYEEVGGGVGGGGGGGGGHKGTHFKFGKHPSGNTVNRVDNRVGIVTQICTPHSR